ncbi:hypothetical protein [Streptosporangium sp. 'caverna']|nr:hypothetical protein [Streptosporangium sp. 'caverna']
MDLHHAGTARMPGCECDAGTAGAGVRAGRRVLGREWGRRDAG